MSPRNNHEVKIREHQADGIQEYDNALPTWWVWLFWGAIVYGIIYLGYYHLGGGQSIISEFNENMKEVEALQAASSATEANENEAPGSSEDPDSKEWATNSTAIEEGKKIYAVNCIGCHGIAGEGGIGPNLTDNHFLHGRTPDAYLNTVSNGVLEKGMPGWAPVLGPAKTKQVTAFAISLLGSNPANPKAPQGDLIEE